MASNKQEHAEGGLRVNPETTWFSAKVVVGVVVVAIGFGGWMTTTSNDIAASTDDLEEMRASFVEFQSDVREGFSSLEDTLVREIGQLRESVVADRAAMHAMSATLRESERATQRWVRALERELRAKFPDVSLDIPDFPPE